jgi:hypothetical protein
LEVVSDRREYGRELRILYLNGQKAKNAKRGHLRLKQGRYLTRENDDIFIGNPTEERHATLEKRLFLGGLNDRDDQIAPLERRDGDILRGGLDGPVPLVPVLVNRVVLEEHGL